jgi:putative oxidoreductase
MSIFSKAGVVEAWQGLTARLNGAGETIPALVMRLVMGWEFFNAGLAKYNGSNWFDDIRDQFPFPFDVVPTALSWQIATWFELVGAVCLWLGLATRFWAFNLLFLTFVATAAVHWPDMWSMWSDLLAGYSISNNGHGNFKLPLLFVVMLLPLVFNGPGKVSLDHLAARWFGAGGERESIGDFYAWSLAALVFGIPFLMLVPMLGGVLIALAIALALIGRFVRA